MLAAFTVSCTEDDGFIKPVAKLEISSETVGVFEEVTFENLGQGQKVTFFTGKEGEVYGERGARGLSVEPENPMVTTTYTKAGTYNVVAIVTGFNRDGTVIETAIDSAYLIVTDTVRSINKVVYNDTYSLILLADTDIGFSYSPEIIPDGNRNLVIPVHDYRYNGVFYLMRSDNKNVTNASKYAFKPFIVGNSLSITYEIQDEPLYNTGKRVFDHSDPADPTSFVPLKFSTVTVEGEKLDYYSCPVVLPYFTSFSLSDGMEGYDGKFWISRLDYTEYEYRVSVPAGADSASLAPAYVLNDSENVRLTVLNDGKPESDFSGDGEVIYELTYTRPRGEGDSYIGEITLTSKITIKAFFDLE